MIETYQVEKWLYSTLTGDTGAGGVKTLVNGRIYAYVAPEGAAFPLVVYSHQANHDVFGLGPRRILMSAVYQVKVIGKGSAPNFGGVQPIADRLDELLQGASGTTTDGQILSCAREQGISYIEQDGSHVYSHLGGLFRIQVKEI